MKLRSTTLAVALVAGAVAGSACGGNGDSQARESVSATAEKNVVVTFSALGSIVEDLVGDAAEVEVLIPNGMDPHDFEPSARDVETLARASFVVANGLDLEAGLEDALGEVEKAGTPVFYVTDHVTLREQSDGHDDEKNADKRDDHGHGSDDPHVWLDPLTFAEAVPSLAARLSLVLGTDMSVNGGNVVGELDALHNELAQQMATLESCVLLTGHDSLGYFAARYGCEIVGSIVPGFSTAAEATAGELADLKKIAQAKGVKAVFTEQGTPKSVADQMARELGVEVVDLPQHTLPDTGGYKAMMREIVRSIVDGLA